MIRKLISVFVVLIGVMPVLGQTTGSFTGSSANVAPTSTATISAQLQLIGCGANLPIYNGTVLTQTLYPITLSSGSFTVSVPANDQIMCGGQAYTTYALTWLANGFPLAPTQAYRVSAGGTCNVSSGSCLPTSFIPPVVANASGAYCPSGQVFTGFTANYQIQCGTAPTSTSLLNFFQAGGPYATTQAAVTAAGTTGYVQIVPNYAGSNSFLNPNNLRIIDTRPFNPTNSVTGPNGYPLPPSTIKAADYGALCDGVHDDTAAINAAAQSLTSLAGGTGGGTTYMGASVVELPQGRCEISAPIILKDYGSLQGNNTWIYPLEPWLGGTDGNLVEITATYFPTTTTGDHQIGLSKIGRFVRGINFEYNYNATAHTAIKVFNPTGTSATTPYPSGAQFAQYQIPMVSIQNNSVYGMDTGFDIHDCGECLIQNNQINFVRLGIVDYGNNYGLSVRDNTVQAGTWSFTAPANRANATWGLFASLETRWGCSNTALNCAGGTATQNIVVAPQGLNLSNDNFEQFDNDIYVSNIQGMTIDGGVTDFGGNGPMAIANPGTKFATMYFAPTTIQVEISNLYCASTSTNAAPCIEIGAPTANAGTAAGSLTYNGAFTIHDSYFDSYNNSGSAIQYDSGTFIRNGDTITNNKFFNWTFGVLMNHPLQNSVIANNYAVAIQSGGGMIDFNAAGAQSFTGTVVRENTSNSAFPVLIDSSGSGYVTGFNRSGTSTTSTQVTGQLQATGTGCSIAAGLGNLCGPVTVALPTGYYFTDTAYVITGCTVQSASNAAGVTLVAGSIANASFTVYEISQSASAVSGGTINCTVFHP